jgi:hypothetical protein
MTYRRGCTEADKTGTPVERKVTLEYGNFPRLDVDTPDASLIWLRTSPH